MLWDNFEKPRQDVINPLGPHVDEKRPTYRIKLTLHI